MFSSKVIKKIRNFQKSGNFVLLDDFRVRQARALGFQDDLKRRQSREKMCVFFGFFKKLVKKTSSKGRDNIESSGPKYDQIDPSGLIRSGASG